VEREQMLRHLRSARVGRLATVTPEGRPHVVPFVFAVVERGNTLRVYWVVDDKPKRSPKIQRLRNLEAHPVAEFVVDGYDEDWDRLWWVRAGGTGRLVREAAERAMALAALSAAYPHYRNLPEDAVVVAIDVERLTGWSAS
jgi:PPOX class probable F420-dependent enzyme